MNKTKQNKTKAKTKLLISSLFYKISNSITIHFKFNDFLMVPFHKVLISSVGWSFGKFSHSLSRLFISVWVIFEKLHLSVCSFVSLSRWQHLPCRLFPLLFSRPPSECRCYTWGMKNKCWLRIDWLGDLMNDCTACGVKVKVIILQILLVFSQDRICVSPK